MTVVKLSQNNIMVDISYQGFYKAGAMAALAAALLFRRNLDAEWMLLRSTGIIPAGPAAAPTAVVDWFVLLQQNPILGLTFLNLFDLVNYALLGFIIAALCMALNRASRSAMAIAAGLGLVGIALYFASNQAFAMLFLSGQYAAASSEAQWAALLSAGQAVLAIHHNASYAGSSIYPSFLLVSLAGLIISVTMLRDGIFSRGCAVTGLLANGFGLAYYLVMPFAPSLVAIPISISAVFLLVWYLMVARRLWALGSLKSADMSESLTAPSTLNASLITH